MSKLEKLQECLNSVNGKGICVKVIISNSSVDGRCWTIVAAHMYRTEKDIAHYETFDFSELDHYIEKTIIDIKECHKNILKKIELSRQEGKWNRKTSPNPTQE